MKAANIPSKRKVRTGTREWSEHSFNIGRGCSHGCLYCYARADALRFGTVTDRAQWEKEALKPEAIKGSAKKYSGVVMFPTTHDITPYYLGMALRVLENLLSAGNDLLVVSKPHLDCIQTICEVAKRHRDNLLFRFTISTLNASLTRHWEPGAPGPEERLRALMFASANGFRTSVSMEPMIDSVDATIETVRAVLPFVTDDIWVGKMNRIETRVQIIDAAGGDAVRLIREQQSDREIMRLVGELESVPQVRWKDSIQEVNHRTRH